MKYLIFLIFLYSEVVMANFKLPAYERYQLDNGLTVYLMPQAEVPLVHVKLVVKAGSVYDEKYGQGQLTAESLRFGAGGMSKSEIDDLFDFHGANFSVESNSEQSLLKATFLKDKESLLLKVFSNIVLQPRFDEKDFEAFKKRYLLQLKQKQESPSQVISQILLKKLYGDHPYGNPSDGQAKSVEQISLDDVKNFYKKFYQPDNAALVVVGDINVKNWKKIIEKHFGAWKGNSKVESIKAPLLDFKKPSVLVVDKSDAKETTFLIGQKGISWDSPDQVAISVVNTILGGRFTSWLNDELRVNSGLSYGANSRFVKRRLSGVFYMSSFTKTESTVEAIDLAIKTYHRLWEKGIDQKTLDSARAYMKGQFPPRYETNEELGGFLGDMFALGLKQSYVDDFSQKVDGLDVKDVNEVIKKYFHKDNLQIVMIGQADIIQKKAGKYGEVSVLSLDEL